MNLEGTYAIVISPSDPDVWNWVSTGGLNQGTISIPFQDLGNSSTLPTVSSQVVKLDDLPSVLPADQVRHIARPAGSDRGSKVGI